MRSSIGSPGALVLVLTACGGTVTTSPTPDVPVVADAGDVVDAVDVMDVAVAVDAGDVVDVVADRGTVDVGTTCSRDLMLCGGVCANVSTDARHCGACGHACCPSESCAVGTCIVGCPPGMSICRPTGASCPICADLTNDTAHCGGCNRACAAGQGCVAGVCTGPTCAAVTEPPSPMGVCDGRGRIACEMWAQGIAGGRPNVVAQCLTLPSGCAKADRCDDPRDATTCRCGAEPACGPNQVCELVGPIARCNCARP